MKLAHPPIVEAVIDLRVKARADLEVSELRGLQTAFGVDAYPITDTQISFSMAIDAGVAREPNRQEIGALFRSADKLHVIQAQRDGFAFSRLAPYTSWEDLVASTATYWKQYVAVARPISVTRLAVRYINRLPLPGPTVEFQDWIPEFPRIPEGLPQGIGEMVCRTLIPTSEIGPVVVVTIQFDPGNATPREVPVVFDLDVFSVGDWAIESPEIWDALGSLRKTKNDFFFTYLSQRTLELFK